MPDDLHPDTFQLVIPPSLVAQVFVQVHDSSMVGHPGKEHSLRQAQSRFWWPSMRRDIVVILICVHLVFNIKAPRVLLLPFFLIPFRNVLGM